MNRATSQCSLHPTPQPSICFTCNQINRDGWGSTEQQATSKREDK